MRWKELLQILTKPAIDPAHTLAYLNRGTIANMLQVITKAHFPIIQRALKFVLMCNFFTSCVLRLNMKWAIIKAR